MKKILLIIVMLACIAGYGQTGATRGGSGTGATTYLPKGDTTGETFVWNNTTGKWSAYPGAKFYLSSAGNVGIGTTSPLQKLHVVGNYGAILEVSNNDLTAVGNFSLNIVNNNTTTNNRSTIWFADDASSASASFGAVHTNHTSNYADFAFATRAADGFNDRVRIKSTGEVGIGTTAPATKLQVKDGVVTIGVGAGTNSGTVTIDTVNAIRLTGKAIVWDDLMFPFSTGLAGGLSYPTNVPDSGYYTFVVDTTGPTKCIQYMTIQMPHRWANGVDSLYPHVHYKHESGVGTPKFIVKYRWVNIGDPATPVAWNWCKLDKTTGTTDKTHQMVYASKNISSAGKGISSLLMVQVYLSGTPTNVNAYQFDIHYPINSLGSNTETLKD